MPHAAKNHIAAFFFSLIILVPVLLIIGLQGWQQVLKFRWQERLEAEAVQTIKVPFANVAWQEEGREFTVDGQFFDVISYRTEGGHLIATGVFDNEETRLQTFLNTQYSHSPQNLSIIQLLLVIQCFAVFLKWSFPLNYTASARNKCWYFLRHHTNPWQRITTPPPRFLFYERSYVLLF